MTNAEATTTETAATVAEQGAQNAPKKASSKKDASQKKGAPKAKKAAKQPAAKKPAQAAPKKAAKKQAPAASKKASKAASTKTAQAEARVGSKTAAVLELLRRKDGATLAEIAKATKWQNHSIRGFISGTLTKKMGLAVDSSKNAAGERTYRTAK